MAPTWSRRCTPWSIPTSSPTSDRCLMWRDWRRAGPRREGSQPTAVLDTRPAASYAVRLCYEWVMAREQGGEQAPPPAAAEGVARGSRDLVTSVPLLRGTADTSQSLTTVLVALGANVLIAVAKS